MARRFEESARLEADQRETVLLPLDDLRHARANKCLVCRIGPTAHVAPGGRVGAVCKHNSHDLPYIYRAFVSWGVDITEEPLHDKALLGSTNGRLAAAGQHIVVCVKHTNDRSYFGHNAVDIWLAV